VRRVLFVDDEPQILEGLRDATRSLRRAWQMQFALGGAEALELVAAEPFDVVVSDMRMPGIDGAAVLARVRELRPDAVRVVLSGYSEVAAALRAAEVAHLSLTKPCTPDVLRATIERACGLQELVTGERDRRAAAGLSALPSAPDTFLALRRAAADPETTAGEVAAIVERDVAMSAKVLQLVNSAFFGLGRQVESIEEAVRYLGLAVLKALVASEGAFTAFAPARPVAGFDIASLQRHSALTGHIARRMLPDKERAEAAFTAGMLHDVGELVLAGERRTGADHAALGAYVLGLWGLPHAVVEAVAFHHAPARLQPAELDVVVAVHVADHLAHRVAGAEPPPLDEPLLARLGVLDRLGEWRAAAEAMR
jgi:HD-like signal output (HDOD) protein